MRVLVMAAGLAVMAAGEPTAIVPGGPDWEAQASRVISQIAHVGVVAEEATRCGLRSPQWLEDVEMGALLKATSASEPYAPKGDDHAIARMSRAFDDFFDGAKSLGDDMITDMGRTEACRGLKQQSEFKDAEKAAAYSKDIRTNPDKYLGALARGDGK